MCSLDYRGDLTLGEANVVFSMNLNRALDEIGVPANVNGLVDRVYNSMAPAQTDDAAFSHNYNNLPVFRELMEVLLGMCEKNGGKFGVIVTPTNSPGRGGSAPGRGGGNHPGGGRGKFCRFLLTRWCRLSTFY